jgi:hypothetical protein
MFPAHSFAGFTYRAAASFGNSFKFWKRGKDHKTTGSENDHKEHIVPLYPIKERIVSFSFVRLIIPQH